MKIVISQEQNNITVKELFKQMRLSTKLIRALKYCDDGILLNGEKVTVRHLLRTDDILLLKIEDEQSNEHLKPVNLPIEIIYEDAYIVIPSKPANMPTHPSHDHYEDTVANALAYYYLEKNIPFTFRPVNRLDRNTSGLVIVAKNRLTAEKAVTLMENHSIQKNYLAILDGELEQDEGNIDTYLKRTQESIILRRVCEENEEDAQRAITHYQVLTKGNGHSLVLVTPKTGRTHQLRVHFAYIGHPITGDDLYGTPSTEIERHALHAYKLVFPHPENGEVMTIKAPLPEDMEKLIKFYFPRFDLSTI